MIKTVPKILAASSAAERLFFREPAPRRKLIAKNRIGRFLSLPADVVRDRTSNTRRCQPGRLCLGCHFFVKEKNEEMMKPALAWRWSILAPPRWPTLGAAGRRLESDPRARLPAPFLWRSNLAARKQGRRTRLLGGRRERRLRCEVRTRTVAAAGAMPGSALAGIAPQRIDTASRREADKPAQQQRKLPANPSRREAFACCTLACNPEDGGLERTRIALE